MPRFFRHPPISPMTCREAVELVTAYLDGALEPRAAQQFERHLARCEGCRIYIEQMRIAAAGVTAVRLPGLPAEICADLVKSFRHWQTQERE